MRFVLPLAVAAAITASASSMRAQTPDGDTVFAQHCAICHEHPTPENKAPPRDALATLGPDAIFASLTEGNMRIQGQPLTPAERIAVAERVAGRPLTAATDGAASARPGSAPRARRSTCATRPRYGTAGAPTCATRASSPTPRGITAANVASLKLKWAFGVPNATQSRSQPADRRRHACSWRARAEWSTRSTRRRAARIGRSRPKSGVRTAISVGPSARTATPRRHRGLSSPTRRRARTRSTPGPASSSGSRRSTITRPRARPARRRYYDGRLYVVALGRVGGDRGRDAGLRVLQVPRQPHGARRDDRRRGLEDLHGRRAEAARQEHDAASSSGDRPARRSGARRRSTRSAA